MFKGEKEVMYFTLQSDGHTGMPQLYLAALLKKTYNLGTFTCRRNRRSNPGRSGGQP